MYLDQIVISELNNSVITFRSKDMPQDWVGTELLEVSNVPYEFVKSDTYGTLEKVGDWMRFTTKTETEFNEDFLKNEFSNIKKWMNQKNKKYEDKPVRYEQPRPQKPHTSSMPLDHQKVQLNFQEFLIKYNMPLSQEMAQLTTSNVVDYKSKNNNYKNMNYNVNKFKSNKVKA
jgi:hypothetical protein